MTGTGKVAEKGILDTYGMKVIQIPTNRKKQFIDYPGKIYATLQRRSLLLEYVKHYHEKGNPIAARKTNQDSAASVVTVGGLIKQHPIP